MEISIQTQDDVAIFKVAGKIVRDNQEQFKTRLEETLSAGVKGIALDLEGVDYLDSAGLGACASAQKLLKERNQGLLVTFGASPSIEKMWKLIRLDLVIPLFRRQDEALAHLREALSGSGA